MLLGVGGEDDEADAAYLAEKTAGLRIFQDEAGKMNRSVTEIAGQVLNRLAVHLVWRLSAWPPPRLQRGGASGACRPALPTLRVLVARERAYG